DVLMVFFFFSSRRRHTRWPRDWSSDVCSSDLVALNGAYGHRKIQHLTRDERRRWGRDVERVVPQIGFELPTGAGRALVDATKLSIRKHRLQERRIVLPANRAKDACLCRPEGDVVLYRDAPRTTGIHLVEDVCVQHVRC